MAKTVWDYGIAYKYGYSKAYGSSFHTGEDWTVTDRRKDVQVTVNGIKIGIAGTTGYSTGIHTHVGKWKAGRHYPPNGKGKTIPGAVVTQVDTVGHTNNGKFVRVRSSDGYDYVYLHLASVSVKVGQKLVAKKPASKPVYTTVKRGEGLSHIARRVGMKDWFLPTSWQRISNLNKGGVWTRFNTRLKPGQKIRVK